MSDALKFKLLLVLGLVLLAIVGAAMADDFPTEAWPSDASVQALGGTVDTATGLPYIAAGTGPTSTPPLAIQYHRREQRLNQILAMPNQGRVVKVTSTTIGVFPLHFRIQGVDHYYAGTDSQAVSTSADTYYVYLTSDGSGGGTLHVVADGTGWPVDLTTFVPLAEVTVASSVISSITDVRNRLLYATVAAGDAATTGTDSYFFVLDQDNASTEDTMELLFNRGSTAGDASLRWDSLLTQFAFLADVGNSTSATVQAKVFASDATTGTAPLSVLSTTKVSNLNADSVDGIGFASAPAAANGIAYSTSTSAVGFTAAATAADVLYADGSGVPKWGALGEASGVQAYDADLDALAGVSATGLIARIGAGAAAARTLTAGNSITVTNGDGLAGNPTISVSGATQYAVQVGAASGALASIPVGASNTVLAGNSGANPTFRQIVNADIATGAAIEWAKLAEHNVAGSGVRWNGANLIIAPEIANHISQDLSFFVGAESADKILVSVTVYSANGAVPIAPAVMDVWLADSGTDPSLSATACTSVTMVGGKLLHEVVAGKMWRMVQTAGNLDFQIEYTGGAKTWVVWVGCGTLCEFATVAFES